MKTGLTYYSFLFIIFSLFILIHPLAAQTETIPFASNQWNLINAEVINIQGREALMGTAVLTNSTFRNGTIEVDIFASGNRSYPGIIFRIKDMQNYERLYIRPHRHGFYGDDIQYTPVINGIAGWQLYNGDGYTAGMAFPDSQWVHLKLEVDGDRARIYLNNGKKPTLVVRHLQTGIDEGGIGLLGPKDKTAYFSNFSYVDRDTMIMIQDDEPLYPYGIIRSWEISQPFKIRYIDLEVHPEKQKIRDIQWQKVESNPSGLVDIANYTGRTSRAGDCIFARTFINSQTERILNLKFGYSDAVSIFINGELHFFGSSAYRQRDPSFLGIIGLHDAVYLPIKKGTNEIVFAIAESFGGWGFIAQDGDALFEAGDLSKNWEIANQLDFPESVIYDKKRDQLYVSNYFNDGQEYISILNLDGTIKIKKWVSGLNRPTGMCIAKDHLYVVDRTGLTEVNIDSGKIINKFPISDAAFLNDVTSDSEGNFYISDNDANRIYKLSDTKAEIWLEDENIIKPNGLYREGDNLLVGTSGDGCLKSVNLKNKVVETIACIGQNSIMDGIKSDGKDNILISDFNGRIFRISKKGVKTELLNRMTPGMFCADFEYIPDKNLLIVPSLYDNRITAYNLTP